MTSTVETGRRANWSQADLVDLRAIRLMNQTPPAVAELLRRLLEDEGGRAIAAACGAQDPGLGVMIGNLLKPGGCF